VFHPSSESAAGISSAAGRRRLRSLSGQKPLASMNQADIDRC
jgi:hypothetical protein